MDSAQSMELSSNVRLANSKAGIKPTAPLSVFDKENSIEFLLDLLHYIYNYYCGYAPCLPQSSYVKLANSKAGIKPTAPLSAFDKENLIEFPLDSIHYLYKQSNPNPVLLSHASL